MGRALKVVDKVCSVTFNSLRPDGLYPARLLCSWDSLGKNTGVGCHFFLQGIFPTQGSKPASPALAGGFFTTEPPGKPKIFIFMYLFIWLLQVLVAACGI